MSYTVKDMYMFLNVSRTTLHNWTDNLADYLSLTANDSTLSRRYNENDLIVLWTCKMLRENNLGFPEITEQLDSGFRVDPEKRPSETTPPIISINPVDIDSMAALKVRLSEYETRVRALEENLQEKEYDLIRAKAERDLLRDLIEQYIHRGDKK